MGTIERIFELADSKFKEQKDFASAVGVKPQRVSEWRRGISTSYQKRLPIIAEVLGTTTEFLLTGKEVSVPAGEISQEDADLLQAIHDRPGLRIMFDLTKSATDEDLKKAVAIIEALYGVGDGQ